MSTLDAWSTIINSGTPAATAAPAGGSEPTAGTRAASSGGASIHFAPPSMMMGTNTSVIPPAAAAAGNPTGGAGDRPVRAQIRDSSPTEAGNAVAGERPAAGERPSAARSEGATSSNGGGISSVENPVSSILWQSPIEKIGRNLQSHNRVAMVADGALYVCLAAGGVTRTIALKNINTLRLCPPTVVQVSVGFEPDLVMILPSDGARLGFVNAVKKGKATAKEVQREGTGVVEVLETPTLSAEYGGAILGPYNGATSISPDKINASIPPASGGSQRGTSPPNGGGGGVSRPSAAIPPASSGRSSPQGTQQQQQSGFSPNQRPSFTTGASSVGNYSVGAAANGDPQQQQGGLQFDDRFDQRRKQIEDLKSAVEGNMPVTTPGNIYNLQAQVDAQAQVIENLQKKADDSRVVEELRRDLDHSKSLITDLQTALRAQEGVFQEMLRAQESLRVSEDVKNTQEKQLTLLREEKKSWKTVIEQKDKEIAELNDRLKLKEIEHEDELAQIRKAFAEYDANVATYLEGLRTGNANLHMPITAAAPHGYHAANDPALAGHSATLAGAAGGIGPSVGGGPSVATQMLQNMIAEEENQKKRQQQAAAPSHEGSPEQLPTSGTETTTGTTTTHQQQIDPQQQQITKESIDQSINSSSSFLAGAGNGVAPLQFAGGVGGHSSESESLQNVLVDRLNKYANRKYHLPLGHPAPMNVPNNRYPGGTSTPGSPPSVQAYYNQTAQLATRGGPGGVSFSPARTVGSVGAGGGTPGRLRDRSIL